MHLHKLVRKTTHLLCQMLHTLSHSSVTSPHRFLLLSATTSLSSNTTVPHLTTDYTLESKGRSDTGTSFVGGLVHAHAPYGSFVSGGGHNNGGVTQETDESLYSRLKGIVLESSLPLVSFWLHPKSYTHTHLSFPPYPEGFTVSGLLTRTASRLDTQWSETSS